MLEINNLDPFGLNSNTKKNKSFDIIYANSMKFLKFQKYFEDAYAIIGKLSKSIKYNFFIRSY